MLKYWLHGPGNDLKVKEMANNQQKKTRKEIPKSQEWK